MVKVTLTVEGNTDEVIVALRQLSVGDAASPALTAPVSAPQIVEPDPTPQLAEGSPEVPIAEPEPEPPPVPEGRWTIDHVRTFWEYLGANAKQVYHRVAHSSGYVMPRQALLDALGLTERQLSGRMSSQGHAVRRMRRRHNIALPHPMSFDVVTDDYKMLPDVADAIVRLNLTPSVPDDTEG